MTYYNLIKLAEDSNKEEKHTGKILAGLAGGGYGASLSSKGKWEMNAAKGISDELVKKHPDIDRDAVQQMLKGIKHRRNLSRGAMGLGGLLAGYGAYKEHQSSKNVTQQEDRKNHADKILAGVVGGGASGAYANLILSNLKSTGLDNAVDELQKEYPDLGRGALRQVAEEGSNHYKRVRRGAMGLGGLLAGYGAYKTYQANKPSQG